MQPPSQNENITIIFSQDEALVLFDWLSRFNEKQDTENVTPKAIERQICYNLEADLERVLPQVLSNNYATEVEDARKRLRKRYHGGK